MSSKPKKRMFANDMQLARQVTSIIREFRPVCGKEGRLNYAKIARGLGISEPTIWHWLNPKNKYYRPKFAKAIEDAKKRFCSP